MKRIDKTDNYNHILKYTGIFGGVQFLSILIAVVRNKLVAVILGPSGVGLMSLFNSTTDFMGKSSDVGIGMSATRRLSDKYANGGSGEVRHGILVVRSWSVITASAGMLLCVALSPLLNMLAFNTTNHTLSFILISPIVGMLAINGGELAILKGTKRLRQLAKITVYDVVLALVISVPIFYLWGVGGIIPALLITTAAQTALTISFTYRMYPPRLSLARRVLIDGTGLVSVGVPFLLAGILGSGAEFLVRSFLSRTASLDVVGLYNAGYMITMVYAGMVFSAMETDYFPRLSANNALVVSQNQIVNQQIEVALLIISPMLVLFIIFLPFILPLLYSGKFIPALGMMQVAALAMYMRAIVLPIAYLPLSKGDSRVYLLMEGAYYVMMVATVSLLYTRYGLVGAGMALTVSSIMEFAMQWAFMHWKYKYSMSSDVMRCGLLQVPVGIFAYATTLVGNGWICWTLGGLLIVISCSISLYIIHSKTKLWQSLAGRFRNKG